jgi:hypothetical protein
MAGLDASILIAPGYPYALDARRRRHSPMPVPTAIDHPAVSGRDLHLSVEAGNPNALDVVPGQVHGAVDERPLRGVPRGTGHPTGDEPNPTLQTSRAVEDPCRAIAPGGSRLRHGGGAEDQQDEGRKWKSFHDSTRAATDQRRCGGLHRNPAGPGFAARLSPEQDIHLDDGSAGGTTTCAGCHQGVSVATVTDNRAARTTTSSHGRSRGGSTISPITSPTPSSAPVMSEKTSATEHTRPGT